MGWFKKKKKEENKQAQEVVKNKVEPQPTQQPDSIKVTTQFVQNQIDNAGVSPAYFDYEKIKFNKFLTDDQKYRFDIKQEDHYNSYGQGLDKGSNFYKKYKKDMDAINKINTKIDDGIKFASDHNLIHARKAYLYDQQVQDENEIYRYTAKSERNKRKNMDFRGLTNKDYDNIVKKINNRAYELSKDLDKKLKLQHTKILNIINSEVVNEGDVNLRQKSNNELFSQYLNQREKLKHVDESLLQNRYQISQMNSLNKIDVNDFSDDQSRINAINDNINQINHQRLNSAKRMEEITSPQNINHSNNTLNYQNNAFLQASLGINKNPNLDNLEPYNQDTNNSRIKKNNRRQFSF